MNTSSLPRLRRQLLGALALAVLFGCSSPTTTPTNAKGDAPPKSTPATVITLEDFGKKWTADRETLRKKYAGDLLEITGPVGEFRIDLSGRHLVLIPCGTDKDAPIFSIVTREKEPWALVGRGQVITVRGKLDAEPGPAYEHIPYILDAELVSPKPNTSITIKAADLAAEVAKDRKGTIDKYKDKSLIVVGEVAKLKDRKSVVFLKGTDALMIECNMFEVVGEGLGKPLKEGKEARIYGLLRIWDANLKDGPTFSLRDCLPILGAK
jgi:hypothetical protein